MNKKLLCAALLAGIGFAQQASAQEFDDRWYLTAGAGFNIQDDDRNTEDTPFGTLGFGKQLTPEWSLDTQLNYQNPATEKYPELRWSQYGVSLDLRRHFPLSGKDWHPYLLAGLGYQKSEERYYETGFAGAAKRTDGNIAAKLGAGLQGDVGKAIVRAELAYRIDFDDKAVAPSYDGSRDDADSFADLLPSISLLIPLGPKAVPAPPPAPVAPPPPPPPVAPPPPPPKVTIDLKGVNFDFNKATLRPDSIQTLDTAAEILKRHPELKVEVAGHTDLCGNDAYNQKLSESRAKTVYDYLVKKGTPADQLDGPHGYGESRPLVQTPQTVPACKSETNRRTELNSL